MSLGIMRKRLLDSRCSVGRLMILAFRQITKGFLECFTIIHKSLIKLLAEYEFALTARKVNGYELPFIQHEPILPNCRL